MSNDRAQLRDKKSANIVATRASAPPSLSPKCLDEAKLGRGWDIVGQEETCRKTEGGQNDQTLALLVSTRYGVFMRYTRALYGKSTILSRDLAWFKLTGIDF